MRSRNDTLVSIETYELFEGCLLDTINYIYDTQFDHINASEIINKIEHYFDYTPLGIRTKSAKFT